MTNKFMFREEVDGGFKVDRKHDEVKFLNKTNFADEQRFLKMANIGFDVVKRPSYASNIALTAPLAVWHETTKDCNLECSFCGDKQNGEEELSTNQTIELYKHLAESGVIELRLTGGEACTREDIGDLVWGAKHAGLKVSLTSNGVYNNNLRKKIVGLPIDLYIISLEGTKEVNDSLRGNTYDSAMKTITTLCEAKEEVRVNTVLQKANKDDFPLLVDLLVEAGVKSHTLIPLRPVGKAGANFFENKLSREEYKQAVATVGEIRKKYPHYNLETAYDIISSDAPSNVPSYWSKMCVAGIEAACMSPSGKLRACILQPDNNIGDLKEHSLMELWHNDKQWGIFRDMERRVLNQCKTCDDYTTKCAGSCLAMTEFAKDPKGIYCFKEQLTE